MPKGLRNGRRKAKKSRYGSHYIVRYVDDQRERHSESYGSSSVAVEKAERLMLLGFRLVEVWEERRGVLLRYPLTNARR